MSGEPWTPGPWTPRTDNDGNWHIWSVPGGSIQHLVAHIEGDRFFEENQKAADDDARLISLAPEMAELLEQMCNDNARGMTQFVLFERARDLLARARGEGTGGEA